LRQAKLGLSQEVHDAEMYCYGIGSEWRLCEEAHLNLAYRWFCRLSLEDVPAAAIYRNTGGRRNIPVFSNGCFCRSAAPKLASPTEGCS
jgi:hypothetical protein